MNFDWNRARAFLVTAEEGSLSAAARALNTAQPTVGRQVAALEEELNVVLFDRVGKQLILTQDGLALLDHVRNMSEAARRVSLVASGQSQQLDGEVCIAATEAFSVFVLPKLLLKLRKRYPGIVITVVASDKISNLSRREADIAIRNVRPLEDALIARKIGDVSARLYATQQYLSGVTALESAIYSGFNRSEDMMQPLTAFGLTLNESNFPVVSENLLVQWELTKLGGCIGIMMEQVGEAEPAVTRVFTDDKSIEFPVWLVAHKQLKSSKRIRVVFDILAEELKRFIEPVR